ncbi:MAG TPA: RNA polymerase sigma factor [Tepidisphaeraceae bacterium]|jgi:RNA polymerase sigma-70 factor (ECF subfamily)|nr:RNA polymerase sigma factor [Tepidisphaeraceae bacterium]
MEPKASESSGELPGERRPEVDSSGNVLPSDGDLVAQVLAGNRDAYDVLIRRYQRQAVAVSYRLLGNSHDAMEVTQDAFLKSYSSLATLQKPEAFGGWLMRIVSNLSLNYRRGRRSRAQLPLDDFLGTGGGANAEAAGGASDFSAQGGDPLRRLQSEEMGRKLQEALASLPEKQRQAIILFTMEEMPQKEVAVALNCSVEAVKWHVFQGRKKLREMLKDVM